jgi:hypothetical protein
VGLAKAKDPRSYTEFNKVLHNTGAEPWDKGDSHGIGIDSCYIHQGIILIQCATAPQWW